MKYFFLILTTFFSSLSTLQAADSNEDQIPIIITVVTADFGSDTVWELIDDNTGEQYGTSGLFLVDNTTYIDTLCVPDGSALTFRVTCCVNNMGSYKVEMLGVTIAENGNFQFRNEISFIATELPELEIELSTLDMPTHLLRGPQVIAGKITNLGRTVIESFDLNWRRGSQTFTQAIEGVQLQPFEEYVFEHEELWQAEVGEQQFIVFLTNINGGDDGSLMNNSIVRQVEVLNSLSQRTVLYENFTNASCSICAVADPIFSGIVLSNSLIAAISYHVNFPGLDVMYQESPVDVDARLDYHQVLGSPFSVIEGGRLRDQTQFVLSANVNAFRENDALVNLAVVERVIKEENGNYNKVVVEVYVTPNKDISSSNLRLQTVIVEREVLYEFAPGSNGLTDFSYVMRKMLPTFGGTPLSDLQANETQKFTFEYEIADYIKDKEQLRSVVFVENAESKEILQTLKTEKPLGENNRTNLQKLGANFGYLTAALQHNSCASATEGQIEVELFGETEA